MPTGQQIITRAVTVLNIIDDGGGISASESAGLLIELNAMCDAWATEETLIPSISVAQYALTANKNPYTFGPGGDLNAPRPVRVDSAHIISTVGAGTNRNDVAIVGSETYFEHNDLSASASSPDEMYLDYADLAGLMTLYFFPVPTCPTATKLEVKTWNAIAVWVLGTNQTLSNGYEDALVYGLAYRCIARYGAVVNQAVAEIVTGIGKQAKDRIRELNVKNRLLDPSLLPQQAAPAPQAGR